MALPTAATIRTVVYVRISKDRAGDELGVRRQEKDGRALAERNGWAVVDVLVDNDVEASSGKRRPSYERMLDMIRAQEVDAVIVWDLDRLVRRPIELEQFFAVAQEAGLTRLATIGEEVNITNGDGLLMARIKGAVAAEEVRKLGQRARRKHLELAEAGKFSGGGHRRFGLTYDPETQTFGVVETEKARIVEACDSYLAGESWDSIARRWNEAGVLTATGKTWKGQAIRQLLMSARIAGLREYRGEVIGDAIWPAMVDRDIWERVQAKIRTGKGTQGPSPWKYLLSTVARCGICGNKMESAPVGGKGRYRCSKRPGFPNCGGVVCQAAGADEWVAEIVLTALDSPEMADALAGRMAVSADEAAGVERVGALESKLEELAGIYAADEISAREWMAARKPIEGKLEAARSRFARSERREALVGLVGHGAELRERWDQLPFGRKRAVIEAVIDQVHIDPAPVRGRNTFDRSRISIDRIVWRV